MMRQTRVLIPLFCVAAAFFALTLVHLLGRETDLLQSRSDTYLQVWP